MQLTFKKSVLKEKMILEPLKEERVTISSSGGVLDLSISVDCASDIKPLEESPAVWTLDLPGTRRTMPLILVHRCTVTIILGGGALNLTYQYCAVAHQGGAIGGSFPEKLIIKEILHIQLIGSFQDRL